MPQQSYEVAALEEEVGRLTDEITTLLEEALRGAPERYRVGMASSVLLTVAQTMDSPHIAAGHFRVEGVSGQVRRVSNQWEQMP